MRQVKFLFANGVLVSMIGVDSKEQAVVLEISPRQESDTIATQILQLDAETTLTEMAFANGSVTCKTLSIKQQQQPAITVNEVFSGFARRARDLRNSRRPNRTRTSKGLGYWHFRKGGTRAGSR